MKRENCQKCGKKLTMLDETKGHCEECNLVYLTNISNFEALKKNYYLKLKNINKLAVIIFTVTTLVIYFLSLTYVKMQTRLYRAASTVEFVMFTDSKLYSETFDTNPFIFKERDLLGNSDKIIKSREVAVHVINSLGLIGKNASQAEMNRAINEINRRLRVSVDFKRKLVNIILESAEPKKATMIVNMVAELYVNLFPVKLKEEIDVKKIFYEDEILRYKRKIEEVKGLKDVEAELEYLKGKYKENRSVLEELLYREALFSNPVINVQKAIIPSVPFYPNERRSALAGLYIGIIIGLLITFFLTKPAVNCRLEETVDGGIKTRLPFINEHPFVVLLISVIIFIFLFMSSCMFLR